MHSRLVDLRQVKLLPVEMHESYLLSDFLLGFFNLLQKECLIQLVAHKNKVDDLGILAARQITHEVDLVEVTNPLNYIIDHVFKTGHLHKDPVDVGKQGML